MQPVLDIAALFAGAPAWVSLFVELIAKVTLLLAGAGLVAAGWRRASAAARHMVWFVALASAAALPLAAAALPGLRVVLLPASFSSRSEPLASTDVTPASDAFMSAASGSVAVARTGHAPPPAAPAVAAPREAAWATSGAAPRMHGRAADLRAEAGPLLPESGASPIGSAASASAGTSLPWSTRLFLLWLAGAACCLLPTLAGFARLRSLARSARPVTDERLRALAARLARELEVRRPVRLLESDGSAMPMTWGSMHPVVLLPASAATWPDDRRRNVLVHELAHVRRRDCLTQLIAQVACALYWFHPLVWVAARRLRIERERACDDQVLRAGSAPSGYATHLLDVARSLRTVPATGVAALAMARRSQLEGRLVAVLDATRSRGDLPRPAAVRLWGGGLLAVAALAVLEPAVAAAAPLDAALLRLAETTAPEIRPILLDARDSSGAEIKLVAMLGGAAPEPVAVDPTGTGAAAPVPAAASPGAICFDRANSAHTVNIHSDSEAREWTVRMKGDDCQLEIRAEGELTFTPDLSDVTAISRGGFVEIEETTGGTKRRIELEPTADGGIARRWFVDGESRPFDAAAQAWLAAMLQEVNRRTGFAAKAHVKHLLSQGGVPAVLDEVGRGSSDHVQRIYLDAVLASPQLDPAQLQQVVDVAGRELGSDYELAELLIAAARRGSLSAATAATYVGAVRSLGSDYERRRALSALLEAGHVDASVAPSLLQASGDIGSDYEQAELLIDVARRALVDDRSRQAFFASVRTIGSDYERRRVLGTLLELRDLSPAIIGEVLEAGSTLGSDYEQAEFLIAVSDRQLGGEGSAGWQAFMRGVSGIGSDYEHRRVLSHLLGAKQLEPAQVQLVLQSAKGIDSDYELAELLIAVARRYPMEGALRDAYLDAAEAVGGEYEYGRVMSAVRGTKRGRL